MIDLVRNELDIYVATCSGDVYSKRLARLVLCARERPGIILGRVHRSGGSR